MRFDIFENEATVIYLGLKKAEKSLLEKGYIKTARLGISEDYITDLIKMYKHLYNMYLKSFIKSSGRGLEESLNDLTYNIFLSERLIDRRPTRSKYTLPDGVKLTRAETIVISFDSKSGTLFNFLAQIISLEMIDFKKDSYKSYKSQVNLTSEEGDSLEDEYFQTRDDTDTLINEVALKRSTEELAKLASENSPYDYETIEFVFKLLLYSFQVTEIAKIMDVPYHVIKDIRENLKEVLMDAACSENGEILVNLYEIDDYLKDLGGTSTEFRNGVKTKQEVEESPLNVLQSQLKEVLGRDYYKVQEIREHLDRIVV